MQRASEAEERLKAVEELQGRAVAAAKETARELSREGVDGLHGYGKPELVDLAATMGIEKRTEMRKDELVSAIMKAARERARGGARA